MRSGILEHVLQLMKSEPGDKLSKLTVLSFDEMSVRECFEYDIHDDEVVGPHKKMQVIMARSLICRWKEPVFVDFDCVMKEEILLDVISELYCVGYTVVACVCDNGTENRALWNAMKVSKDSPYFLHPSTNEKIICFPDVPHLLKLFRNWLLDTGFILGNGRIVTKDALYKLLEVVDTEISVAFKLKESHLTVRGCQRQNVRKAAELVSHTVACALKRYGIDDDLADVIQLINDWFDLFNTRTVRRQNAFTSPYGVDEYIDEQNELLKKVRTFMEEIRCVGKSQTSLQVN